MNETSTLAACSLVSVDVVRWQEEDDVVAEAYVTVVGATLTWLGWGAMRDHGGEIGIIKALVSFLWTSHVVRFYRP